MWLRDCFRSASEWAALTHRAAFYEAECGKLEFKVAALEKEVKSERRRYDKFRDTYFNQISVKHGLYGAFDTSDKPKHVEQSPELSPSEILQIEDQARQIRDQDLAQGNDWPIETYIEKMTANPERYIKVE